MTYSQDPSYDYSKDEPSEENRRINDEQLRRLRAFIEYRSTLPVPTPRPPQTIVRTGRSVCTKKINLLRLRSPGCN